VNKTRVGWCTVISERAATGCSTSLNHFSNRALPSKTESPNSSFFWSHVLCLEELLHVPLWRRSPPTHIPLNPSLGSICASSPGEPHLAAAMSNALNYYFGSTAANPTIVTAATYSMLAGDAYVVVQPTATTTLTLPNCIGQTGAIYTINNSQSAQTVAIKNLIAAETINGVDHSSSPLTIPFNSTMRFRDVALPSSTGGCVWNSF
jgi:hypothetical protein